MVTIILVVYKSDEKQLNNILKKIGRKYKIIIIDNSLNYDFSKININKHIKIIRSNNYGNGAGINLALKKCKTKYAIYTDIDVSFGKNFVLSFIKESKKLKNFSILIPNHGNIKSNHNFVERYNGEAAVMLFNFKSFKKKNLFDEKFFLYFEEIDLLTFCKKNNLKCYLANKIKIKHQRATSIVNDTEKIRNLRNWHYMWSMFYYNKKNFGFFKAFGFTINFLIKDLAMTVFYILILNPKKMKERFYRVYGASSSILGFKSFLRP